jgi:hypothetical protein
MATTAGWSGRGPTLTEHFQQKTLWESGPWFFWTPFASVIIFFKIFFQIFSFLKYNWDISKDTALDFFCTLGCYCAPYEKHEKQFSPQKRSKPNFSLNTYFL